MLKFSAIFLLSASVVLNFANGSPETLAKAYPEQVVGFDANTITMKNGKVILYDDRRRKTLSERFADPDLEDQLFQKYPKKVDTKKASEPDHDPGRIRCESFFKAMYGMTADEVGKKCKPLIWLSESAKKLGKDEKIIEITTVNGVFDRVSEISKALDRMILDSRDRSLFNKLYYLKGGRHWRKIAYSNPPKLSTHAFATTVDLNIDSYWAWTVGWYMGTRTKERQKIDGIPWINPDNSRDFKPLFWVKGHDGQWQLSTEFGTFEICKSEGYNGWRKEYPNPNLGNNTDLHLSNEVVQVFQNNGFIWGGNWFHYDPMHFEYRPELLEIDVTQQWNSP